MCSVYRISKKEKKTIKKLRQRFWYSNRKRYKTNKKHLQVLIELLLDLAVLNLNRRSNKITTREEKKESQLETVIEYQYLMKLETKPDRKF